MGSDHIREASRHPRAYCVTGQGEGGVGQPGGGMGEHQKVQELAGRAWGGWSRADGALTLQNPKPCLCRQQTAGPVASARNVGAGVISSTPIKHTVSGGREHVLCCKNDSELSRKVSLRRLSLR